MGPVVSVIYGVGNADWKEIGRPKNAYPPHGHTVAADKVLGGRWATEKDMRTQLLLLNVLWHRSLFEHVQRSHRVQNATEGLSPT